MTALILPIFLLSLTGSLHCAGMCGAFVALAVENERDTVPRWRLQAAYHLGRLATYLMLGAAAGVAGQALDLAGALIGSQRVAAALAGAMMIGFGLLSLGRALGGGWRIGHLPLPPLLERWAVAGQRAAGKLAPLPRAAAIGLLTTFLPCGWLWIFVSAAAGTASWQRGVLVMAVFWVGTLPVLVTLGASFGGLSRLLGKRLPVVTALAIVAVGIYALTLRVLMPTPAWAAHPASAAQLRQDVAQGPACCAAGAARGATTAPVSVRAPGTAPASQVAP
jgi:sulfite exporter TauE/SafE